MRIRYSFSSRRSGRIEGHNRHKQPMPKLAKDVIKISDIVLEVLDARYLEETRNKEIEKFIKEQGKFLIYVLNKADLIELAEVKHNLEISELEPYVFFSCKTKIGRKRLREMIKIEVKRLKIKHKKAHVGVVGYPNTGKSSLINLLSGRKAAGTAAEAGFTKGISRIRFNKDILILDTPGVISEIENANTNKMDLKKEAKIGVRTYDKVKEPDMIISRLMLENPGLFERFYEIEAKGDAEVLLEQLGRKKGFLAKGNKVDADKIARYILKDWQEEKITRSNVVNSKSSE
ncbi:MAG: GTPase [Nanoarchaeota archaeon]